MRNARGAKPKAQPLVAPAPRPYVPPRVIRRAGSEVAASLPSVAAGKQYWPRGK